MVFVANVSSGTITSYINGSLDTTATSVTVQTMYNLIGAYQAPTGSNGFVGKLDEVAIFNKALSLSEVGLIYDATNDNLGKTGDLFTGGLGSSLVYWNRMGDS